MSILVALSKHSGTTVLDPEFIDRTLSRRYALLLAEILIGDAHWVLKHYPKQRSSTPHQMLGWRPPIPDDLVKDRPAMVDLVQSCWRGDAGTRPSFLEIAEVAIVSRSRPGVVHATMSSLALSRKRRGAPYCLGRGGPVLF